MDTQVPTSEIQRSNRKLDQLEINFNKKPTLLENFSLEDIFRLSFFSAGRMEKVVPGERLQRAGSIGIRQDEVNSPPPQLQLELHFS